jgi:hypothetical protein
MTDRNLRTLVAGLTGVLIVVVAIALLLVVGRNGPGTATRSATPSLRPTASASPSAAASVSPSASAAPTVTASAPPSAPASVAPSAAASSSPLPAGVATATFIGLKLDATDDPAGQARVLKFTSDGPGTVTAKLASTSPQGTTHMCLLLGTKHVACKDLASGTFTGKTTQAHANWQVTLEGTGIATPTVNLTLTFQAAAPAVTIEHARFDGTAFPDTNGIQVRFTAQTPGDARLVANWGGHPFQYEVDLFDETSGSGDKSFPNQGPSTNVDQSIPVTAGTWRLVLQNVEAGFGVTELTATISWP